MEVRIDEHVTTWCYNWVKFPDNIDLQQFLKEVKENSDEVWDIVEDYGGECTDVEYDFMTSEPVNDEIKIKDDRGNILLTT